MSWNVPAGFVAALGARHDVIIRVDLLDAGVVVASTNVLLGRDLPVVSGGVRVESGADIRRSGSVDIEDATGALSPMIGEDLLDPLVSREFRMWRGIILDGVDTLVPLGTFGIDQSSVQEERSGIRISMDGRDRAAAISENPWVDPYNITGTPLSTTAAYAIVQDRLPNLNIQSNMSPTTVTVQNMTLGGAQQSDPWTDIQKIAEGAAMEAFFDPMGTFVMREIPDPLTAPIIRSYRSDGTGLLVLPLNRRIDRRSMRNGVVVRGEAPWLIFPVKGEAWDTDPNSPTYYDPLNPSASRVGPHPEEIRDAFVGSDAQAAVVAAAKLKELLGIEETYSFSSVVDPSIDAGDVLELQARGSGGLVRVGVTSLSVPLGEEDSMEIGARRRRS